ncbi:B12-binding domain-containing radical SAM protein [Chloroflexota bacterium]
MNIVLVNPRLRAWSPTVLVPLGLAYIAAVLERGGHSIQIIDMNADKVSDESLQRGVSEADLVGVTGMVTEYQEVLRIAGVVKRVDKHIKVVLGGPLATTFPRDLLHSSQVDFVVIGEGERTIVDLIANIKQGSSLFRSEGIGYKDDGQIVVTNCPEPIDNLDGIPFPARHLLDMARYTRNQFHNFSSRMEGFGKIRSASMVTSRGCPYGCIFCYKGMWGRKWRGRTPVNVVEEMEFLQDKYNVNGFFFHDDTFVLDIKRVFQFCHLLKEKKLNMAWGCNGRANLMTKELLQTMYEAGCREIAYGIESGDQGMLDLLHKDITLEQIRNAVEWTKEAGIRVNGYFMIGLPGETKQLIRRTIAFAKELKLDFYGFSLFTPLPNTEIYKTALEGGLIKDITSLKDWDFNVNVNLTEDCSDEDLIAFQNEIFKKYTLKNFGGYYIFNPAFLKRVVTVAMSLQNGKEVKDLARRVGGIIQSYWHKV